MARGRGSKPTHYIALSSKTGNGKYDRGPYIGLWEGDDDRGPLFRGSVQGKYLDELFDYIKSQEDNVSFAIFKSQGDKGGNRRNRDEDNEDAAPRGRSGGRSSRRDDRGDDRGGRGERDSGRGKSHGRGKDEDEDRGSSRGRSSRGKSKSDPWED